MSLLSLSSPYIKFFSSSLLYEHIIPEKTLNIEYIVLDKALFNVETSSYLDLVFQNLN